MGSRDDERPYVHRLSDLAGRGRVRVGIGGVPSMKRWFKDHWPGVVTCLGIWIALLLGNPLAAAMWFVGLVLGFWDGYRTQLHHRDLGKYQ